MAKWILVGAGRLKVEGGSAVTVGGIGVGGAGVNDGAGGKVGLASVGHACVGSVTALSSPTEGALVRTAPLQANKIVDKTIINKANPIFFLIICLFFIQASLYSAIMVLTGGLFRIH